MISLAVHFSEMLEAAACATAASAVILPCGFCGFAESSNSMQQQLRGSSAAYDSDICHRYSCTQS